MGFLQTLSDVFFNFSSGPVDKPESTAEKIINGIYGMSKNTERNNVQRIRNLSDSQLRQVIDNAPDAYYRNLAEQELQRRERLQL